MSYRNNAGSGGHRRPSALSRFLTRFMRRLEWMHFWRDHTVFEDDPDPYAHSQRPATGLPEADLTEEQRQDAVERIRRKPRVG